MSKEIKSESNIEIKNVLFDIGGVLTPDPWETILLDEEHGLHKDAGAEVELAEKLTDVWSKYSHMPEAQEGDFWQEASVALGLEIDQEAVNEVTGKVVVADPQAVETFDFLQQQGVGVGIISNNTAFFWPVQRDALGLEDQDIDPSLIFLSHEEGRDKGGGLFETAAQVVDPKETLIIDDRQSNIDYAKFLGYQTMSYSTKDPETSLLDEVRNKLG
jgi:FMN phosphatase YigB (HAD superfamily)